MAAQIFLACRGEGGGATVNVISSSSLSTGFCKLVVNCKCGTHPIAIKYMGAATAIRMMFRGALSLVFPLSARCSQTRYWNPAHSSSMVYIDFCTVAGQLISLGPATLARLPYWTIPHLLSLLLWSFSTDQSFPISEALARPILRVVLPTSAICAFCSGLWSGSHSYSSHK